VRSKDKYYWLLLILPLALVSWYLLRGKDEKALRELPYFGPGKSGAITKRDSLHHVLPFDLTNQFGEKFNADSVRNEVFVAEFFFTTCKTICPVMNRNLVKIHEKYAGHPKFRMLSFTVDPETDDASQLKKYSESLGVSGRQWIFLTGPKAELYHAARRSFLLDNSLPATAPDEDFVHTQNVALVDREGFIRGIYDATDTAEVHRLGQDIMLLNLRYDAQ
jgi:protein SCO1/2